MRLPKFRIMNNRNNWVYFTVFHSGINVENFKTETLGEFTGLHDKSGVEIYEGDIIELITYVDEDLRYEIIFEDCGYYAKSPSNKKISIGGTMHSDKNINIEVIGNIYENGELLK